MSIFSNKNCSFLLLERSQLLLHGHVCVMIWFRNQPRRLKTEKNGYFGFIVNDVYVAVDKV